MNRVQALIGSAFNLKAGGIGQSGQLLQRVLHIEAALPIFGPLQLHAYQKSPLDQRFDGN
ncbi:MAG: hypothetical protein Fur0044_52330 [Anaerolineae bacterium]